MNTGAEQPAFDFAYEDTMIRTQAKLLRGLIEQIPPEHRTAVFERVRDLLPVTVKGHPKAPQRGGTVLSNVYELFRREPNVPRGALEVQQELEKQTESPVQPQAVRNALNYLNGRQILQRIGYGRYRLLDGSTIEGPP